MTAEAALAQLKLLAALRRSGVPAPKLAGQLVAVPDVLLARWRSSFRRRELAARLTALAEAGQLAPILALATDATGRAADQQEAQAASARLARIDAELARIEAGSTARAAAARSLGQEAAAGLALAALAFSIALGSARMSAHRDLSASRSAGPLIWAQGLACGGVLAFAPALALLATALFWPVAIAFARDGTAGRPNARGAALGAAAASVGPICSAWSGGLGLDAALNLATDLHVLASAWCAAAAGWLLTELAPFGARAALEAASKTRAARLRAERTRLVALWEAESSADSQL